MLQFPRIADGDSAFVMGTNNFSNTRNLVKHEVSEHHKRCVDAQQDPENAPLNSIVSRLSRQQNESMIKLFRTAYCLVKQNFSLRSFEVLLHLQECNGVQLGRSYRNRTAACDFFESIATIIQQNKVNHLKSTEFFSLLIDGSTDVSVKEQEIVHIKYLENGMPVTLFLGLIEVENGTAEGILEGLGSFFSQLGVANWKTKLVGLGKDGASVNVGSQSGLGAILKRDIPYLIQIHCIAHKLELAVLDACKQVNYVEKFQNIVKRLLKYYSKSGKRLHELSEVGKILSQEVRSFGKWNPIRWIASKSRILKVINSNFSAVVTHLEEKAAGGGRSDEALVAKTLLKDITAIEFVYFLGFMCDLTTALGTLSQFFQLENVTLSSMSDELDATLGFIQLQGSPGHTLASFINEFDDINGPTKFRNIGVSGGKKSIESSKRKVCALASGTVTYLEKRFTLYSILQDFEIFDPSQWPIGKDRNKIASYGNEELLRILNYFSHLFSDTFQAEANEQWLRLKFFVCKRISYNERQFHELWPKLIKDDKRFSTILQVIAIVMLLPMSTASCERGFSLMNRIKSKGRSRVTNSLLNNLMSISCDTDNLDTFDLQPAINQWSSNVHRRPGNRKEKPKDSSLTHTHTYTSDSEDDEEYFSDTNIIETEYELNESESDCDNDV